MRYKVPRHVDYKAKILGPATFSQLLYVGAAGLAVLFFYLIIGETAFFYPIAAVLGGGGVSLAFVQVSGQPLPEYLQKMIMFQTSSREYIWEKKIMPMDMALPKKKPEKEEEDDERFQTQTTRSRRLGNIADKIETF